MVGLKVNWVMKGYEIVWGEGVHQMKKIKLKMGMGRGRVEIHPWE